MTEKTNQDEFKITSTMWFDLVKSIAVLTERMDAQIAATNALRGDMTQQISSVRGEVGCFGDDMTKKVPSIQDEIRGLRDDMTQQISLIRDDMRFYLKLYVVLATVFGGAVMVRIGMFFA